MSNSQKQKRKRLSFRGETLETRSMMHGGVDTSIDFEDLMAGDSFVVGDSFVADDAGVSAQVTGESFQWADGTNFGGGSMNVNGGAFAGHVGQDLNLNNVVADFDFGSPVDGLSLNFGEFGGNINVQVNNDFYNVENVGDLDGKTTSDGAIITVPRGGHGVEFDQGVLVVEGPVHTFKIGGQELWIDHVHPGRPIDVEQGDDCIDFEDMRIGAKYGVGDTFLADLSGFQAKITGRDFTYSGGGTTSGGNASVVNGGQAGHLGNDIAVNNILLDFDFGGPVEGMILNFGEYGGNLNLMVNGDFINFEDFADVNGLNVGGVDLIVVNGHGDDSGTLKLDGIIEQFAIGGQELWIDHICPCEPVVQHDCIDFEDLIATKMYNVGSSFLADDTGLQADIVVSEFEWSGGGLTADGFAMVDTGGVAGHAGQDIMVNNVNLDFEFGATVDGLTLQFGEFGGNLNLEVNGDFVNFEDFMDVDGMILGGVVVSVPVGGSGGDTGQLKLDGLIESFAIGGQELWIDHVCVGEETPQEVRMDWGDAPDQPYPTMAASDGARHRVVPGFHLGRRIDADPNGQPNFMATGDDTFDTSDDDDGVQFLNHIVAGSTTEIEVDASAKGFLDAWADFNQDGKWQASEQIFATETVWAGTNTLSFDVPDDATPRPLAPTYLRFRYSLDGSGLTPVGYSSEGEVEDYRVLQGDSNQDGTIDDHDIDDLCRAIHAGSHDASYDLNNDGVVDDADHAMLVEEILQTSYGDANLDGVVDAIDLNVVGLNWQGNGGWADGNFDCDRRIDASDLNLLGANWMSGARAPMAALAAMVAEDGVNDSPDDAMPLALDLSSEAARNDDSVKVPNRIDRLRETMNSRRGIVNQSANSTSWMEQIDDLFADLV